MEADSESNQKDAEGCEVSFDGDNKSREERTCIDKNTQKKEAETESKCISNSVVENKTEECMESSGDDEDDDEEDENVDTSLDIKDIKDVIHVISKEANKENDKIKIDEKGEKGTISCNVKPNEEEKAQKESKSERPKRKSIKKSYKFENSDVEDSDPEDSTINDSKTGAKKPTCTKPKKGRPPKHLGDKGNTEKIQKTNSEDKSVETNLQEDCEKQNPSAVVEQGETEEKPSEPREEKKPKSLRVYVCDPCNLTFVKKKHYRKHYETNPACNPFTCSKCNKTCKNMSYLQKHMFTHNGEKLFCCDLCEKKFSFAKQLREHKTSNSHIARILNGPDGASVLTEECKVCTKKFESQEILNAHFSLFHSEGAKHKFEKRKGKNFMCDDCGAMCSTNAKLKIHKRTHTKEKPYKCPYCEKSYGHDISLTRHIMIHTGDRPYICDFCGKSFNRPHNLKLHMSTHTGIRAYSCDICNKGFNQRGTLQAHKLKAHDSQENAKRNSPIPIACKKPVEKEEEVTENVITVQVQEGNVHELNITRGEKVHNVIIPQLQVSMGQTFQLPDKIDWSKIEQPGQQQDIGHLMIQNSLGNDVGIYIRMEGDHLRQINQHPTSVANDIVISYPEVANDVHEDVEYYFDGNFQPPNIASNVVAATNYHEVQQHQPAPQPAQGAPGNITENRIQDIVENEDDKNLAIAAMTELQYKFLKSDDVPTEDYQQQVKHDHVTNEQASGYYENPHLVNASTSTREDPQSFLRTSLTANPSYQYQVFNTSIPMYSARDGTASSQIADGNTVNMQMPGTNMQNTMEASQITMMQNYQHHMESPVKPVEHHIIYEREQVYPHQKYTSLPHVQATYENETYLAAETLHQMDQSGATMITIENADLGPEKDLPASIILKPDKGKKAKKPKLTKRIKKSNDKDEEIDISNLHICDLCDAKFEELPTYKKHMESHVPSIVNNYEAKETLVCDICKEIFTDSLEFSNHIENHAKHKAYQCKVCEEFFNNKRGLIKHMAYHIGMTVEFPCSFCSEVFKNHRDFKAHYKENHLGEDQIQCDMCEQTFSFHKDLKEHHMKSHGGKKNFKCSTCSKSYFTYYELQKHKSIHENTSQHTCPVCNKSYKWKHDFRRHVKSHTTLKIFPCVVCDKVFTRRVGFNEHLISAVHRTRIQNNPNCGISLAFSCDVCDGKYESEEILKFHKVKEHNPEKESTSVKRVRNFQYVCKECGVVFRMSAHLKNHMRTHTKEKPFQCETCGKKFRFDIDFRRHRLEHTGERPFMCDTCGKTFNRKANLRLHSVIHTGQKQFVCDKCGEAFIQNSGLQYHRRKAHGMDRPYICKECGEGFQYNKQLRYHTNAIHKASKLVHRPKTMKKLEPSAPVEETQSINETAKTNFPKEEKIEIFLVSQDV